MREAGGETDDGGKLPFQVAVQIDGVVRIHVHVIELRSRIDAQRERFGLPAFRWTDSSLSGLSAKAVHVLEMRLALQQAYAAAVQAEPSFTALWMPSGMLIK